MADGELELVMRVWTDYGAYFEVDGDGDALGLVRLTYYECGTHEKKDEIIMTPDQARGVAEALKRVADSRPTNDE